MIIDNIEKGLKVGKVKDIAKKDVTLELSKESPYRLKDEKYITINTRQAKVSIPAKGDVEYENFTPQMRDFLKDVALDLGTQDLDLDFVITSGTEGEHSKDSLHYTGQAIDVRIAPKFRGETEGVDTPWDDPMYKYFYEGSGKSILSKHKMNLLDDLTHGSSPHIHIEEGTYKGGNKIKTQSDFIDTHLPPQESLIGSTDISKNDIEISTTNFLADISNEVTAVENQSKEVANNPALKKLIEKQTQRQQLQESIIEYSKNAFVSPKEEQQIQQSPTAYRPNQLVQTQFRTLEQAVGIPDFEKGGNTNV